MSDFSNFFLEKLTNQRFSYRQYSKVQFAGQGIVLEQNKEPALSGGIRPFFTRAMENVSIEDASPEDDIITISRKAGIVDENTGRPLYLLLERAKNAGCRIVVADALDDEPYISSQLAPALEMTDLLVRGAQLACEAIAADEVRVEIYKELGETRVEIGETLGGLPVDRVGAGYPADNSLIQKHREEKAFVFGVGSLIHLARAVDEHRMQTTTFLTVAGDGVSEAVNLEVTLDKTAGEILRQFGLSDDTSRVVIGGSMRGTAITDLDSTRITPVSRGLLALREVFRDYYYTCIGCGKCTDVCPVGLSPYYLYQFVQSKRYERLEDFDIDLCISCGTCSYVCPAKLNVSAEIARGQMEMLQYMTDHPKTETQEEALQ